MDTAIDTDSEYVYVIGWQMLPFYILRPLKSSENGLLTSFKYMYQPKEGIYILLTTNSPVNCACVCESVSDLSYYTHFYMKIPENYAQII